MIPTNPNTFQYKRATCDPLPTRVQALRQHGPGGQHAPAPLRERRRPRRPQPTNTTICAHCHWPAPQSPCASCASKGQPPTDRPSKEPPVIAMGPLPAPKQSTPNQPARASEIDCRALTEPCMSLDPTHKPDCIEWRWSGERTATERDSIIKYMERIGCVMHYLPGVTGGHYYHPDLWICVALLEREGGESSITIGDYSKRQVSGVSPLLVIEGGAA